MGDSPRLYLGLISGTSADAIDVVLASFEPQPRLHASLAVAYPPALREQIIALARTSADVNLDTLGGLDVAIGRAFADAAMTLLGQSGISPAQVHAIGTHGQTVRHRPFGTLPFSLQLGDPNQITERCGITTVADFRGRDLAAGGQGAPLLPAFHQTLLATPGSSRVVLNLGGIANITVLPGDPAEAVLGGDTGPANCLMDAWAARHLGAARDEGGRWAAQGSVDLTLLNELLDEPYFAAAMPKSSGRELFNLDWLEKFNKTRQLAPVDVQASLLALTVQSVANAIGRYAPDAGEVLVCGGGVHNPVLYDALESALQPRAVTSTAAHGVDPDFVEAMAFAWLAHRRIEGLPGNLASVTGASGPRVLGAVYFGASSRFGGGS